MRTSRILAAAVAAFVLPLIHGAPRDLNTPREFPPIQSRADWTTRAGEIRQHILVSCGLWPLPEKTPLKPKIFGRIERDGYSVEKVYFESYTGFFVCGNLYRPLGRGTGPFPGVLNPHGHSREGRLADSELFSTPGRCINLARMGMVAFTYDMTGYNDTAQVDHKFAAAPANQLWNISLMGLQTWNSIRALDFLESLPEVDKTRLACTGESGGGTQTFMLGAVDGRLAAQAPVVMVSHIMQGGCLCENAPGLRVEYSNMEIAAQPAPRPQFLVSATGDWTRDTMTVEGPSIRKVYDLFGAGDRLNYVIFPYEHNYNKTSREAVYAFLGARLLNEKDPEKLKEMPFKKEPDPDLRVFPDGKLPPGALNEEQLIAFLQAQSQKQIDDCRPRDSESLRKWKQTFGPVWRHSLQLSGNAEQISESAREEIENEARIFRPSEKNVKVVVVLASSNPLNEDAAEQKARLYLDKGMAVICPKMPEANTKAEVDQTKNYFTTYNRTVAQQRVADLRRTIQHARDTFEGAKVVLAGEGEAGLWSVLAAPFADAVIADCNRLDETDPNALLDRSIFFPGYRKAGGLQGAAALAAPHPLLVHNTGEKLNATWLEPLYKALGREGICRLERKKLEPEETVAWLGSQFQKE